MIFLSENFSLTVPEGFKSGFITLVGRPNAGKSTLANAAVGDKVAITSSRPQTTRHRLRAIVDGEGYQMILVDTPGLHKPHDALGEELNHSTIKALEDVDAIALLIDATKPIGKGDEWVANLIDPIKVPKLLVVTKADLCDPETVAGQIKAAGKLTRFEDMVAISALKGVNVDGFLDAAAGFLPEGPRWFPEGMGTDQPIETLIAEFIREKVLKSTFEEIPYSVGVQVDDLVYKSAEDRYFISAIIYCERDSQKGIIIGHGGEMIKKLGTAARSDLQKLLGCKVHLDLYVKVKKAWRRDAAQVRRFGYGEGL